MLDDLIRIKSLTMIGDAMGKDDERRLIGACKSIKRARQYIQHVKSSDDKSQRSIDIIHSNLRSAQRSLQPIIQQVKDETNSIATRRAS